LTHYKVIIKSLLKVFSPNQPSFSKFLFYFRSSILKERNLSADYLKELNRKLDIIDAELGHLNPIKIDLFIISKFLNENTKTPRMFNQYRSLLHDIFVEMMDNGIVTVNIAKLKKPKKYKKSRNRLSIKTYQLIHQASPHWLRTAMDLSLQTSHGRNEIVRIKYSDIAHNYLRIRRQKNQHSEASFVEIPISNKLSEIIDLSFNELQSPFIVHNQALKITRTRLNLDHITQVTPEQLTREFKRVRDSIPYFDSIPMNKRPTFHEIRALSIFLGETLGFDMKARAGHSDRKMTEKYIRGHSDIWNRVENMEIDLKNWSE